MMGMLSHIVTTYPNTAQSNVTSHSGDCMHWTCLLLYCLSIASRPIHNKNGAKKVYVCYSVFPKCEKYWIHFGHEKTSFVLQIYLSRYWLQRCLQQNRMLRRPTHYRSALPHYRAQTFPYTSLETTYPWDNMSHHPLRGVQ